MAGYYVGIDGGGTATKCLVADENGRVLARSEAGPSNYLAVGRDAAAGAIGKALAAALQQAGARADEVAVAALGMAGGDRPKDREVLMDICRSEGLREDIVLDHDAMIALLAGTDGKPGVVVIAGTGSIAFGFNEAGDRCRVDGWGYLVGDHGSGYDIGRQGIVAVLWHYDGRGPATRLTELFAQRLQLTDPQAIIGEVYAGRLTRREIAGLSPLVFEAAEEGDEVAARILQAAGTELGLTAGTAVRRLKQEAKPVEVVCAGGVFKGGPLIREPFAQKLRELAPQARTTGLELEPAVGALYLAFQDAGLFDSKVVAEVKQSYRSVQAART